MIVKVVPIRPIPGILPKNKWVDSEMVLDLNKNEIIHCMQYGNVYDEDGNLFDAISVHKKSVVVNKPKVMKPEVIKNDSDALLIKEEPVVNSISEEVVIMGPIEVIEDEPAVVETEYFDIKVLDHIKEENSIILITQMDTNSKLEGSLYGLFNITSGPRPTLEYKVNDEWVKFNNKFSNFETIENGDKFVFRLTPKNNNEFAYKLLIKQANDILVSFEEKINPETI